MGCQDRFVQMLRCAQHDTREGLFYGMTWVEQVCKIFCRAANQAGEALTERGIFLYNFSGSPRDTAVFNQRIMPACLGDGA